MKEVIFVILEGFADWEGAYIATCLNQGVKPGNPISYKVKTLSITQEPVSSIGGFRVLPDYGLKDMAEDYAGLVLIGGMNWFSPEAELIVPLVEKAIKEKKLVAFHEAGHAVMGLKLDGANEVQKITIIPRGHAGGYTMMTPKEESFNYTKNELLESICGLLGGRVAEEVTFGEITTGAHDDFKKATKIARSMVTEYGMSSLGPMMLEEPDGNTFLGRDYTKNRNNVLPMHKKTIVSINILETC